MLKNIKEKLALVPNLPGSYQMKDISNQIIYVGKAKKLRNRLKSYFIGQVSGKTALLVNDITDFEYIVTNSELEALILEITLIKKYNPKYNILLKDDKSYPYIELTNELYPRLKIVRNVNKKKNKSHLFGPYPNVTAARKTVNIINRLYPLKKCDKMPKSVCLYYHIKECLGYCSNKVEQFKIDSMIHEIIVFLNGDDTIVTKKLEEKMLFASDNLNYEKALEIKEMLNDINTTLKKQKVDLNRNYNFDLFGYAHKDNYLVIVIFFIRNGILFGRDYALINTVDDIPEEVFNYIIKFYDKGIKPKQIIISDEINKDLLTKYLDISVISSKKGQLNKLLLMANENAKIILNEKQEIAKNNDDVRLKAIKDLERLLNVSKIYRIESFDNSHLFGTFYVGAMVTFDNFISNKNLYRKYKLSLEVKDDLKAMQEVIYRRYYKAIMDNETLPDLILLDGGINQINVAKEILTSLNLNIKVVGLKKDNKHHTNMLIDEDNREIIVPKDSKLFLFLTKIDEEVHRFVITYHRLIRSKGSLTSMLDMVKGIGSKRRKELIKHFGSYKNLSKASIIELNKVLPNNVAHNLYNYFQDIKENKNEK